MKSLIFGIAAVLSVTPAAAESFFDQFRDEDGWFDVSDWVLENTTGFMPVPIALTEPAVGAGMGVAALFFHTPKDYNPDGASVDGNVVEPNITAIAAGGTENGTWFVGGGHLAKWKDDTIRYEGLVGYAEVNLRFYGVDGGTQSSDGFEFKGEALFIQQPLSFRMGGSDFFLGAEWKYMAMETRFDLGTGIPDIDELTLDTQLSGLRLFVNYDALDNSFTPSSGIDAEFGVTRRDKAIGSDFEFNEYEAKLHVYRPLGKTFFLGARLDAQSVSGDVPFFSVPFIGMRGIPAMRYQGENIVVAEVEGRWAMHPRFSVVGFAGAGRAAASFSKLSDASSRTTKGLGLRYLIARKLGMHTGFDVAKGPEDTHYYLTFGSAWD